MSIYEPKEDISIHDLNLHILQYWQLLDAIYNNDYIIIKCILMDNEDKIEYNLCTNRNINICPHFLIKHNIIDGKIQSQLDEPYFMEFDITAVARFIYLKYYKNNYNNPIQ